MSRPELTRGDIGHVVSPTVGHLVHRTKNMRISGPGIIPPQASISIPRAVGLARVLQVQRDETSRAALALMNASLPLTAEGLSVAKDWISEGLMRAPREENMRAFFAESHRALGPVRQVRVPYSGSTSMPSARGLTLVPALRCSFADQLFLDDIGSMPGEAGPASTVVQFDTSESALITRDSPSFPWTAADADAVMQEAVTAHAERTRRDVAAEFLALLTRLRDAGARPDEHVRLTESTRLDIPFANDFLTSCSAAFLEALDMVWSTDGATLFLDLVSDSVLGEFIRRAAEMDIDDDGWRQWVEDVRLADQEDRDAERKEEDTVKFFEECLRLDMLADDSVRSLLAELFQDEEAMEARVIAGSAPGMFHPTTGGTVSSVVSYLLASKSDTAGWLARAIAAMFSPQLLPVDVSYASGEAAATITDGGYHVFDSALSNIDDGLAMHFSLAERGARPPIYLSHTGPAPIDFIMLQRKARVLLWYHQDTQATSARMADAYMEASARPPSAAARVPASGDVVYGVSAHARAAIDFLTVPTPVVEDYVDEGAYFMWLIDSGQLRQVLRTYLLRLLSVRLMQLGIEHDKDADIAAALNDGRFDGMLRLENLRRQESGRYSEFLGDSLGHAPRSSERGASDPDPVVLFGEALWGLLERLHRTNAFSARGFPPLAPMFGRYESSAAKLADELYHYTYRALCFRSNAVRLAPYESNVAAAAGEAMLSDGDGEHGYAVLSSVEATWGDTAWRTDFTDVTTRHGVRRALDIDVSLTDVLYQPPYDISAYVDGTGMLVSSALNSEQRRRLLDRGGGLAMAIVVAVLESEADVATVTVVSPVDYRAGQRTPRIAADAFRVTEYAMAALAAQIRDIGSMRGEHIFTTAPADVHLASAAAGEAPPAFEMSPYGRYGAQMGLMLVHHVRRQGARDLARIGAAPAAGRFAEKRAP